MRKACQGGKLTKLSNAVRQLRQRLGQSQQAFATGLGLSIRSIANYEGSRPPSGKQLFNLAMAAQKAGHFDLVSIFTEAISTELSAWPFQLLVIPATKSHPIRGHLMLRLEGYEQLLTAFIFGEFVRALNSKDRPATVIAAKQALLLAAKDVAPGKFAKMMVQLGEAGGVDPDSDFELIWKEDSERGSIFELVKKDKTK